MQADVAGVKEGLAFASYHDAGRAKRMAGVVKLERRGALAPGRLLKCAPLDLPVVAVALKPRRELVHLAVGVERVLGDPFFVGLSFHHVDRVVQHALDYKVTQFGHHHVRPGEEPQRHRQRADVVVVAVRERDGIHGAFANRVVQRQRRRALEFGMGAGVHQQAVAVHLDVPRAGTDAGAGIEITEFHRRK